MSNQAADDIQDVPELGNPERKRVLNVLYVAFPCDIMHTNSKQGSAPIS
jgi:hypothetical protein